MFGVALTLLFIIDAFGEITWRLTKQDGGTKNSMFIQAHCRTQENIETWNNLDPVSILVRSVPLIEHISI